MSDQSAECCHHSGLTVQNITSPVKTPAQRDKKFASRVAGRQNALRGCPADRTQSESGLTPSALLSDWSAGQLIPSTPGSLHSISTI